MRIPSRWLCKRAQQSFLYNSSSASLTRSSLRNVVFSTVKPRCCYRRFATCDIASLKRSIHTDSAISNASYQSDEIVTSRTTAKTEPVQDSDKIPGWARTLNKYLPVNLQVVDEHLPQEAESQLPAELDARRLEKVLSQAKNQQVSNVFLWLVDNGHRKTAVWLMKTILNFPSANKKAPIPNIPSNIDWPDNIFKQVRFSPVKLALTFEPASDSVHDESLFESGRFDSRNQQAETRLLGRLWETLGALIIKSANAGVSDVIDDHMLAALLVLGHVHNLGMMPKDVYAHDNMDRLTHFQRPPILNLVSSRILTAISDAAWREQQDEAILEAARKGMSLKEISRDVPGGRFRLKVRPLGPEIWLELILWSCIELNQTSAALAIVSNLASQAEDPWFAFRWTSPRSREKLGTLVNWGRATSRRDEPLIEGYSREKPLVDVPDKTVSVEVILALLDKLMISVLSSSVVNTSKMSAFNIHKDFRGLRKTMADIETVMTFLEPHDLPPEFFDFLETRLLHEGAFDTSRTPVDLYNWTLRMKSIRDLQKIESEKKPQPSLDLDDILSQTQVHIGMQHQAMNVLMEFGDVHHTLTLFNELQEGIDQKKVESITDFLEQGPATATGVSESSSKHDLEFMNSHGQLPYYQLAGFLNMISDTKLTGLGRWLLFAEDVDGALIPQHTWGMHCMTSALYKFAAASRDERLLSMAQQERAKNYYRPSVGMLRNLANTNMNLLHLDHAHSALEQLVTSQAGGFGLSNVVHLAASILRLEHLQNISGEAQPVTKSAAINMLWQMLVFNRYKFRDSAFGLHVRHLFQQQIRHVLNVFEMFDNSALRRFAKINAPKFPYSNLPSLPAKEFNILLSAAADTHGSAFAKRMWDRYCRKPDSPYAIERFEADIDDLDDDMASRNSDIQGDDMNESGATREFDVPFTSSPEDLAYAPGEDDLSITSVAGDGSYPATMDDESFNPEVEDSQYALGPSDRQSLPPQDEETLTLGPGDESPTLQKELSVSASENTPSTHEASASQERTSERDDDIVFEDPYFRHSMIQFEEVAQNKRDRTSDDVPEYTSFHESVAPPEADSESSSIQETEDRNDARSQPMSMLPKSISDSASSQQAGISSILGDTRLHGESPVTVPNLNTLRIIIRATTLEIKEREEAGKNIKLQARQLAWAVETFKAFGIVDRDVVEQEIQYPLQEIDAKIAEDSKDIIDIARSFESYKPLTEIQDLRVGAPTSSMWIPFTDRELQLSRRVET